MPGFACPACGAEFETQERLDDHTAKDHSGVEQDAGSAHTQRQPAGKQPKTGDKTQREK